MRAIKPDQLERVSTLLGETVLDPSAWPRVMDTICRVVYAKGAVLLQSDVSTFDVPRTEAAAELVETYFNDGWYLRDTRAVRGIPLLKRGARVIIDQDIISQDEMALDPSYNECFIPSGFKWWAGVSFLAGEALWGLSFQRSPKQGPFEPEDKWLLEELSKRLTVAATLSTVVGRVALTSATNALSLVHYPAIAIDRSGIVLDANAAAEGLFDSEIRVKDRRLVLREDEIQRRLESLIDKACKSSNIAALKPIVATLPRRGRIQISAFQVPDAAQNPFLGAAAILTIEFLKPRLESKAETLERLFALTPAETRLASIVGEGFSPAEAAEKLGVSRVTARNQLQSIFDKTNTHRQSQFVALYLKL
jgi:DNA-binding CsgD family transcriptional regulator